jgi:hypothetical protein
MPMLGNVDINEFSAQFCRELRERVPLYLAAVKIQRWWMEIYLNPYTKVGRRKLKRDATLHQM